MNFKNWLNEEEIRTDEARMKGFYRQFRQANPHLPRYVADQIYSNKLGPELSRSIKGYTAVMPTVIQPQSPPLDPLGATVDYVPHETPRVSPGDLMNKDFLRGVQWSKKPQVVQLSPLDFDENTLNLFLQWRFGFSPKDNVVRNDTERFEIQRKKLMDKLTQDNEPIVLVKDGNKYRLLEGYHRTMTYLLWPQAEQPGAPPDQIQMLQGGGDPKMLDLSKWMRVPIKAYIGVKQLAV